MHSFFVQWANAYRSRRGPPSRAAAAEQVVRGTVGPPFRRRPSPGRRGTGRHELGLQTSLPAVLRSGDGG